jgi:MFS transporter, CP family, cyanate transporter
MPRPLDPADDVSARSPSVVPDPGRLAALPAPAPVAGPAPGLELSPERAPGPRRAGFLLMLGVVLVAINLRAAVTSLGALLEEVTTGLGMSATLAGVVTMLPTLSFAAFGILTPWLTRRYAPARILVVAMLLLVAGQALRAMTDSPAVFVICSGLALSGIAVANVLLPALVRQSFPHRMGVVTGVYTMSLIFGASSSAAATVPIAQLAGSWRVGLGAWALLAAVAVLPWLPAALRSRISAAASAPGAAGRAPIVSRPRPGRTALGWAMATFFGTQALTGYALMGWLPQVFRDAGFAPRTAGLLLAVVIAFGVPAAFIISTLAGRVPDLRLLVLSVSAASIVAYAGLAVAPSTLVVLWVALLAIGQAAFPFSLTMIGLRARTPDGTVALSAFTQGVGYLVAGLGPLLMGVLYEFTGGWTLPMVFLIVVAGIQTGVGLIIARPGFIEDA